MRELLLNLHFPNIFLQSHSVFVMILTCTDYKSAGSQQIYTVQYKEQQRAKEKVSMYIRDGCDKAGFFSPTESIDFVATT